MREHAIGYGPPRPNPGKEKKPGVGGLNCFLPNEKIGAWGWGRNDAERKTHGHFRERMA